MSADPFDAAATLALWEEIEALMRAGKVRAAWAAGCGGIAEAFARCASATAWASGSTRL